MASSFLASTHPEPRRRRRRDVALAALAAALVTVPLSATAASATTAAPAPGSGPTDGGTRVTVELPGAPVVPAFASDFVTVVIDESGELYGWGRNQFGQLGSATAVGGLSGATRPVRIPGFDGRTLTQVDGGYEFVSALDSTGAVWAWGGNSSGQLGNGSTGGTYPSPQPVLGLDGIEVTAIASGASGHTLALDSDGGIWAWGTGASGQLGNGATSNQATATRVAGLDDRRVVAVAAGSNTSYALTAEGAVYAWGRDADGELGDGAPLQGAGTPVQVAGLPAITSISAGGRHALALAADGTAWGWGLNIDGNLTGAAARLQPDPVELDLGGIAVERLVAGAFASRAITSDGTVYGWGRNSQGELGTGTTVSTPTPVAVAGLADHRTTWVDEGASTTVAVAGDGTVHTWGAGDFGNLGNGVQGWGTRSLVPVAVDGLVAGVDLVPAAVTFDGVPGTDLTDNHDGTVTVTTPAHGEGPVDVTITTTWPDGVSGPSRTEADGFRYVRTAIAPTITSAAPADGRVGDAYSHLVTADGDPQISFALTGGALPGGLELDGATGQIEGIPARDGSYTFDVTATNATGSDTERYTLAVTADSPTPTPTPVPERSAEPVPNPTGPASRGGTSSEVLAAADGSPAGLDGRRSGLAATGAEPVVAALAAAAAIGLGLLLVRRRRGRSV